MKAPALIVENFGLVQFETVFNEMKAFTQARDAATPDRLWLVEHHPVFTLGQAGKTEHLLNIGETPVVRTNRGGQVTYHGPGQLVVYLMLDIRRLGVNVRGLVSGIETSIVNLLREYDISANARREAPGVYVEARKIASLGLRISRGCSYHGLSLNVHMDLAPFARINPCGYEGLEVTQLYDLGVHESLSQVASRLVNQLATHFSYDEPLWRETHVTG